MLSKKNVIKRLMREGALVFSVLLLTGSTLIFISSRITAAADEAVEHKRLSGLLEARNQIITEVTADFENVKGAEDRIRQALLPSSDILEFVGALESMAVKNNVTQTFRFDNPTELPEVLGNPPRQLNQINFTVDLQANLPIFLQYLKDVEDLPYFTRITGITLSAPTVDGWKNTSNISVRGTLYTLGDK